MAGNAQLLLYVAAAIVLLLGAVIDDPRFNVTRCIALAFALLVLAQVIK
jgi:drug/metabolite transporter (DMT)-like permease